MKRSNYKNYVWYPVTDEEYWCEDFPDEFPGCQTIVCYDGMIMLQNTAYLGWGTMAKYGGYKFMIINKNG